MEAYQQRVVEEKKELDTKIKNLQLFIESEGFEEKVPNEFEQDDLVQQIEIMSHYSLILQSRINRF